MKRFPFTCICITTLFLAPAAQAQEKRWTLDSCLDYALEKNIQVRKSRISLQESETDRKTAQAALFPNLSFSTSHNLTNSPYARSTNIVDGGNVITSSSRNTYNGNYGLNASWTLYNGGKRLNSIRQQKLNRQAAAFDVAQTENEIRESIAQAYIQILYATESVKTNEETLEVSRAQLDRAKELLAAGSIAQSDYAQLNAQYSTDEYQLTLSEGTLADYKLQLKQLLELDGLGEIEIAQPQPDETIVLRPLPEKSEVYRAALGLRPEIQSSQLNREIADLNIRIAQAGYLPTLSLSAGIGSNNGSGSDFTFAEQLKEGWKNSVGLTLSIPIFNNRQTKSSVEKAKLQSLTARLDYQDQEKTLLRTIESLWLNARNAQQQYKAAQTKERSAQISYDLVSQQFDIGMKNTVELLTEKNNLLSAQQEKLQAKYMAILNLKLLQFYQGGELNL